MTAKLDQLESAIRPLVAAEPTIVLRRWPSDGRVDPLRTWQGWQRWVYITNPGTPDIEYMLFLGWYSDPPGDGKGEATATSRT